MKNHRHRAKCNPLENPLNVFIGKRTLIMMRKIMIEKEAVRATTER